MEMFNHSPLIAVLADNNLAHSTYVGSERITTKYYFFRSQKITKNYVLKELLEKTRVLNHSQKRYLKSGVELSHLTFASHLLRNDKVQKANNGTITVRISVTALLVSLLATCQPSYAIAPHYQSQNNHSFNYVDTVAVTGNNVKQELQNLLTTVKHHTIVDVFFCLSFASLPFMGELRLALALVRLWWGGHGNKPFRGEYRVPCCYGSEPPYRPNFGANHQNIITRQKGLTK